MCSNDIFKYDIFDEFVVGNVVVLLKYSFNIDSGNNVAPGHIEV